MIRFLFILLASAPAWTQSTPLHIGAGVTAPKIIHQVEPTYSAEGRDAHIQGNVVFLIVVDEHGLPTDIRLLSPLGFGLDERARAAIESWKFKPAVKDGTPVKVYATIEVNFRFVGLPFDATLERRRTDYNVAVRNLRNAVPNIAVRSVETIQKLAHEKFPPAMGMLGIMMLSGDGVEKNPEA